MISINLSERNAFIRIWELETSATWFSIIIDLHIISNNYECWKSLMRSSWRFIVFFFFLLYVLMSLILNLEKRILIFFLVKLFFGNISNIVFNFYRWYKLLAITFCRMTLTLNFLWNFIIYRFLMIILYPFMGCYFVHLK